jgi:tRNA(His) 5'-end guanylyltransferase
VNSVPSTISTCFCSNFLRTWYGGRLNMVSLLRFYCRVVLIEDVELFRVYYSFCW